MKDDNNNPNKDKNEKKKQKDVELQPLLDNEDEGNEAKPKTSSLKEFLLLVSMACLSRLLVAGSKICVQGLQDRVPAFQLNAMRCLLPLCGWSLYFIVTRKLPRIERDNIKACVLWSFNQVITCIYLSCIILIGP